MKKTCLALAVAAACSFHGVAQAQDYQVEAGIFYIDFDGDDHAIGVDGIFYLDQVQTAGRPLAEAAFLGRNNNIFASYVTVDDLDIDIFSLGGEFWINDFYVAAAYTDFDGDAEYDVALGYMLSDNLLLSVIYSDGEEIEEETISLNAKYVAKLGNNFVNLEASISDTDGDTGIAVLGDYFFTNEFSAGVRVSDSGVSGEKTAYGVGARYFFTPTISGELEYETEDSFDTIGVRLSARF